MKANVHSILYHNPFNHGCQIIFCAIIIVSNLLYHFVSILVPIYHHYTLITISKDLRGKSGYFDPRLLDFYPVVPPIELWILVNSYIFF